MWVPLPHGQTQYAFKTQRDVYRCRKCETVSAVQHDSPHWFFSYAPHCCGGEMEKIGTQVYDGNENDIQPTEVSDE